MKTQITTLLMIGALSAAGCNSEEISSIAQTNSGNGNAVNFNALSAKTGCTATEDAEGVTVVCDDQSAKLLHGSNGAAGAQGLKGDKGDKGDTGDTGLTGAQGAAGAAGAQGAAGAAGAAGIAGATGAAGAQGPQGPQGAQGVAGAAGADGTPYAFTVVDADNQTVGKFVSPYQVSSYRGVLVYSAAGNTYIAFESSGYIQGPQFVYHTGLNCTGNAYVDINDLRVPMGNLIIRQNYGATPYRMWQSAEGVRWANVDYYSKSSETGLCINNAGSTALNDRTMMRVSEIAGVPYDTVGRMYWPYKLVSEAVQ